MRIENSRVAMSASRTYKAETEVTQTHIDRYHNADGSVGGVRVTQTASRTRQLQLSGEAASYSRTETTPMDPDNPQQTAATQTAVLPEQQGNDWLTNLSEGIENDPQVIMLRKLLDLLERFTGKKFNHDPLGLEKGQSGSGQFRFSASAASARYQQTALLFGAQELSPGGQGGQNGLLDPPDRGVRLRGRGGAHGLHLHRHRADQRRPDSEFRHFRRNVPQLRDGL